MTNKAYEYAQGMHDLHVSRDLIQQVNGILEAVPQVRVDFENPSVPVEKKHMIIDRIFPESVRNSLKILCDNNDFALWNDICEAYESITSTPEKRWSTAQLLYVTPPNEEQLDKIRKFLAREYNNEDITIETKEDKSLKSGFILRVGSKEYDWSEQGRINQLKDKINSAVTSSTGLNISQENIISILKASIEDFQLAAKDKEIGVVTYVADGIVSVDGIDHACYGEIVIFDCGVKGMVQDIRRDDIGVILFGKETEIFEGSRVVRTGKIAGMPVGEGFLGRIVDALGNPIDGHGEIDAAGYRPLENPAPSVVDRESVNVPMETGILAIDSMFPIGRGQRELIIGDRQTGKTSIAMDTILNQKGKGVICIYVAIGQKASTVAQIGRAHV